MGAQLNIAIIGASGAIGMAFVKYYAAESPSNHITAFTRQAVEFASEQVSNQTIDFSSEESLQRAAKLAVWDRVIVTTGILQDDTVPHPEKSFKQLTEKNMLHIFHVNTIMPAMVAKYFLPQSNKQKSLLAILSARVGSIADNRKGGWYSYRASKAALNMVIKNLAIEMQWINKNAIVIGLHPGTVDSKLSEPFQAGVPREKLFSPIQSVKYMAEVISALKTEHNGHCLDWKGEVIER